MKTFYTSLLLLSFSLVTVAQSYYSDFEDDTLQNWTNVDGSETGMSIEGEPGSKYLIKQCDGTSTAVGEMTILNTVEFNGDYTCNDPMGINCMGDYEIRIRNANNFDIHLRMGFTGGNGTQIASEEAKIIPANSDWIYVNFIPYDFEFNVVSGTGTVEETFADIQEMKLFHNPAFAYDGLIATGLLEIEYIFLYILLDVDEQQLQQATIFPNPVKEVLNISVPFTSEVDYTVFDIFGKQLGTFSAQNGKFAMNTSELNTGIYFLRLESEGKVTTKKFIKR